MYKFIEVIDFKGTRLWKHYINKVPDWYDAKFEVIDFKYYIWGVLDFKVLYCWSTRLMKY